MAPVSLHLADCDAWEPALLAATLSADEQSRANRFRHAVDRERFVVRRGLLRRLLGERLGIDPARVPLEPGPAGKPSLSSADVSRAGFVSIEGPPLFNLARSGGLALYALLPTATACDVTGPAASGGPAIGVDLERIDSTRRTLADLRRIADHFASEESRLIGNLPDDEAAAVFYRLWTCKEACLKCLGTGIGGGGPTLADVVIEMSGGTIHRAACHDGVHRWLVHVCTPCPGHVAAVAVAAGEEGVSDNARLGVVLRALEPSPAERAVSHAAAPPPGRAPGGP